MRYKIRTLIVSVIILGVAVFGFFKVKNLFFPDFEYDQLYIEYTLPAQTLPDRVKKDIHEITGKLLAHEEIIRISASQGRTPVRYCLVRSTNAVGDNYAEFIVDFPDYKTANRMRPLIESELRASYPDAYVRARKYNFSIATTHRIELMFSGPDPAVLRQLSHQAENIMRNSPYVDVQSVCNNWQPKGKTLYARYMEQAGRRAGLSRGDVGNALMASTDGLPIGLFYDKDQTLLIYMKIRNADGSRITDLNDMPVWSMLPTIDAGQNEIMRLATGSKSIEEFTDEMFRSVPLSQVISGLEFGWEESSVQRYNGQRAIKAQCDPAEGSTPVAVEKT